MTTLAAFALGIVTGWVTMTAWASRLPRRSTRIDLVALDPDDVDWLKEFRTSHLPVGMARPTLN